MTFNSYTNNLWRRVVSCGLIVAVLFSGAVPVAAQSNDAEPPNLVYEPIDRGVIDEEQLFVITATDNVEMAAVMFSYRFSKDAEYTQLPMQRQGETDTFTIALPESELVEANVENIQYFIEATDAAGNRTLEGFAFNPLTRNLVDASELNPSATQANAGVTSGLSSLSTSQKILYGALGVLAVGALIAASDSGGTSVAPGVDTTIVVDQLPIDN